MILRSPLVEDPLEVWKGINVKLTSGRSVTCRVALTCCTCDLPATWKLLGFSSYNSSCACSNLCTYFPTGRN